MISAFNKERTLIRRLRFYLDTSVFNFIFASDDPVKKEITEKFFDSLPNLGQIFISEVVLREVRRAREPRQTELLELIERYTPKLLEVDPEIIYLAEKYIDEGIIPGKYRDDAIHIAVAVVNDLDVIVSWNFRHIVKLKTRMEANGINKMLGYKEIEICSPEEVI
jgi:predicted nucleic acid-binding protein